MQKIINQSKVKENNGQKKERSIQNKMKKKNINYKYKRNDKENQMMKQSQKKVRDG